MATQKLQAQRAAVVTTSDTANIPNIASENGEGNLGCLLYVGTSGNLKVTTSGGDTVTLVNILGGQFLPISVVKVFATGTTASNIIALW
tara:strand:+ start:180 stop:446 length:267 start_codon:yes stop_codon:yes gene_type:complete